MQERLDYARVLAEMDISHELSETILAVLPNGWDMELRLKFESIFKLCSCCQPLGHYKAQCEKLQQPIEKPQVVGVRQK